MKSFGRRQAYESPRGRNPRGTVDGYGDFDLRPKSATARPLPTAKGRRAAILDRRHALVRLLVEEARDALPLPKMRLVDPAATRIGSEKYNLEDAPTLFEVGRASFSASSNSSSSTSTVLVSSRCFGVIDAGFHKPGSVVHRVCLAETTPRIHRLPPRADAIEVCRACWLVRSPLSRPRLPSVAAYSTACWRAHESVRHQVRQL